MGVPQLPHHGHGHEVLEVRDVAAMSGIIYCSHCGHPNQPGTTYCAACGKMLNP